VNTDLYISKRPTPPLSIRRIDERKKNIGLDIEQIHGHGSQRGPMPDVSVPAGCRQQASTSASVQVKSSHSSMTEHERAE
jgi:hypothetical protein